MLVLLLLAASASAQWRVVSTPQAPVPAAPIAPLIAPAALPPRTSLPTLPAALSRGRSLPPSLRTLRRGQPAEVRAALGLTFDRSTPPNRAVDVPALDALAAPVKAGSRDGAVPEPPRRVLRRAESPRASKPGAKGGDRRPPHRRAAAFASFMIGGGFALLARPPVPFAVALYLAAIVLFNRPGRVPTPRVLLMAFAAGTLAVSMGDWYVRLLLNVR